MVDTTDPPDPPLEKQFEAHLLTDVEELRGRYHPRLFQQMIHRHGGVGTARQLLADPRHTSYGFEKLWELRELERSMEFAVLLGFRPLFTVERKVRQSAD